MTNNTYICIAFDDRGNIEDIELLDNFPSQSFLDGYREFNIKFEIRVASINGGDSSVIMRG